MNKCRCFLRTYLRCESRFLLHFGVHLHHVLIGLHLVFTVSGPGTKERSFQGDFLFPTQL